MSNFGPPDVLLLVIQVSVCLSLLVPLCALAVINALANRWSIAKYNDVIAIPSKRVPVPIQPTRKIATISAGLYLIAIMFAFVGHGIGSQLGFPDWGQELAGIVCAVVALAALSTFAFQKFLPTPRADAIYISIASLASSFWLFSVCVGTFSLYMQLGLINWWIRFVLFVIDIFIGAFLLRVGIFITSKLLAPGNQATLLRQSMPNWGHSSLIAFIVQFSMMPIAVILHYTCHLIGQPPITNGLVLIGLTFVVSWILLFASLPLLIPASSQASFCIATLYVIGAIITFCLALFFTWLVLWNYISWNMEGDYMP